MNAAWLRLLLALLVVCGVVGACGRDARLDSGTSTNWYRLCDEDAECGTELACICGRCTRRCDDATDCGAGECVSSLVSVVQCNGEERGRICALPEPGECSEWVVDEDPTLAATPSDDCVEGALVCEGFDEPFPESYSTWVSPTAEVSPGRIQDCALLAGGGALRIDSAEGSWWQSRVQLAEPLDTGAVHARFYTNLASASVLPEYLILFELWNGPEVTEEKLSVEVESNGGIRIVLGSDGTVQRSEAGVLSRDEWACIELAVTLGDAGAVTLSINGEAVVQQTGLDTVPADAPYSVMTFGAVASTDATELDVLLDELVLSTQPIGCL